MTQFEEKFKSLCVSEKALAVYINGKFLAKRVKDLAGALRQYNSPPAPVVVVAEKKEKDNTAKILANEKKFVQTVLKTVQRVGRPYASYFALGEILAARAQEGKVVDLLGESTPTSDSAKEVSADCGSQYLLTWEQLAQECVSGVPPPQLQFIDTGADRVKEIVDEIVSVYNRPEEFSEPTAVVQSGLLKDVQFKTIESTMEKAHSMHQLRRVLACYSEAELTNFITRFCKSTLPLHNPKRDASMPVWWSVKHDILLLKLSLQYGCGNQKKIIADPLVASAPADFVMPPRIGSVEWVTVLTNKTIDKRVAAVLKSIPPFTHPALPAEPATDKIRQAPEPVTTKKAAGSVSMMNKFSAAGAGADPFKERVFGVKPIWASVKAGGAPTATTSAPKTSVAAESTLQPIDKPSSPIVVLEDSEIANNGSTPVSVCSESSAAGSAVAPSQCSTPVPMLLVEESSAVTPQTPSVPASATVSVTVAAGVACPATPLSTSSSYFITSPMSEAMNENSLFSLPAFAAAEAYVEPASDPNAAVPNAQSTPSLRESLKLPVEQAPLSTTAVSGVALSHSISSDSIDLMGSDEAFVVASETKNIATVTPGKMK